MRDAHHVAESCVKMNSVLLVEVVDLVYGWISCWPERLSPFPTSPSSSLLRARVIDPQSNDGLKRSAAQRSKCGSLVSATRVVCWFAEVDGDRRTFGAEESRELWQSRPSASSVRHAFISRARAVPDERNPAPPGSKLIRAAPADQPTEAAFHRVRASHDSTRLLFPRHHEQSTANQEYVRHAFARAAMGDGSYQACEGRQIGTPLAGCGGGSSTTPPRCHAARGGVGSPIMACPAHDRELLKPSLAQLGKCVQAVCAV